MINILQKITLGGEEQWYVARGDTAELPLLLFLHGGPGSPQTGAQHKFNRELEKHFLVVNWDQRGGGKSYRPDMKAEELTLEQLLSDAVELTRHLLQRFGKDKLYVMGQSMGALMGLQFAERHPELIQAYVGINQPVDRIREEERSYEFTLQEAKRRNIRKAIRALEEVGPPVNGSYKSINDLVTQRTWLTKFGGVTYEKSGLWINLHYIFSSHLTWKERTRFMKGFGFSSTALWGELNSTSLFDKIKEVQVPVYFIMGEHDRIVHDTVIRFAEVIRAPYKELIVFEKSGHLACFEEAERFNDIMIRKVLVQ